MTIGVVYSTMPESKPVVLITGASSGIGLALLQQLSKRLEQYRVVATARNASLHKFEELGFQNSQDLRILALDVTSASERTAVIKEVESSWNGVDILINNAGISYRSVIEHSMEEDVQLQFATNLYGPMHLTRLCLPGMRKKRAGHIINVSSVGGMMAMPTMGLYSASKFALEGFSEALYYEMRPWNIKVSLVQPGFVRSNSFKNVYLSQAARKAVEKADTYANYYWHMGNFISRLMNNAQATPESSARKIIKTMERPHPPLRVPVSWDARFFTIFSRITPRPLYHHLLYRQLPGIKDWGTGNHQSLCAAKSLEEIIPANSKQRQTHAASD